MEIARKPSSDGIAPLAEGAPAVGFDLLQGNAAVAIGLVELGGPLVPHPLRDKARQRARNLRAIDAIIALVGPSIASELKLATLRRIANATR
jgi:hypothetical protein